jgi:hypothetical protein
VKFIARVKFQANLDAISKLEAHISLVHELEEANLKRVA